jgi:uncharacterized phage infection (PIP) family protein YhgE
MDPEKITFTTIDNNTNENSEYITAINDRLRLLENRAKNNINVVLDMKQTISDMSEMCTSILKNNNNGQSSRLEKLESARETLTSDIDAIKKSISELEEGVDTIAVFSKKFLQ